MGKCRRWVCLTLTADMLSKAALEYINGGDMDRAKEQLQDCPAAEASTQYLSFLVAVNTGREVAGELEEASVTHPATTAVEQILNCPDLDGKQLLLMGYTCCTSVGADTTARQHRRRA